MRTLLVGALVLLTPAVASAKEIVVAAGAKVQAAIDMAMPGDVVVVKAGTYAESLKTARAGTEALPITLRGEVGAIISTKGTLLEASHPFFVVDGLVFDAQYALVDGIIVNDAATSFTLRNSEVRRATKDCIDVRSPRGVLIEKSKIHHCLNAADGRTDAHGIVAGAVRDFVIRDTEIHTFSGDAFQLDPDRGAAGWDNVTIERCHFWLSPLKTAENGFAVGAVAGENAVDTKTSDTRVEAGRLTIRDTIAHGFRAGLLTNMAAFNLKENVDVVLDRVTIYDSEIALRMRGPTRSPRGARVLSLNAVIYDVDKAVRYEDNVVGPRIFNATLGGKVSLAFQNASSDGTTLSVKNLLVLGAALPAGVAMGSNLAVPAASFVNAAGNDYHLVAGSPAVDTGETLAEVTVDRDGLKRPQGKAFDRGAYEYTDMPLPPADAAPPDDAMAVDSSVADDASPSADAGPEASPTSDTGGCGCHVSPRPMHPLLLLLGLALLRRRR